MKNELILLKIAQSNGFLRDHRVRYEVNFYPPSYLTPSNWKDVQLTINHRIVDGNNNNIGNNVYVVIQDNPDQELDKMNWKINNESKVNIINRKYKYGAFGDRASYTEEIIKNEDTGDDVYREHIHLAHEDQWTYDKKRLKLLQDIGIPISLQ